MGRAFDVLAAPHLAPAPAEAVSTVRTEAFVILEGTLPPTDRVADIVEAGPVQSVFQEAGDSWAVSSPANSIQRRRAGEKS